MAWAPGAFGTAGSRAARIAPRGRALLASKTSQGYGDPERGEANWARGMSLAPQLGPDVLAFAFQMGTELALIAADYGHAEVRIRQAESHLTAPAWMQFRVAWLRFSRMTNPLVHAQRRMPLDRAAIVSGHSFVRAIRVDVTAALIPSAPASLTGGGLTIRVTAVHCGHSRGWTLRRFAVRCR
jgi:hypothetical protein